MGFLDKLFGNKSTQSKEGELKLSKSGILYEEIPAKKGPWSSEDYLQQATGLFYIQDYKNAIEFATKAINIDASNYKAYSVRAASRRDSGDIVGSRADEKKSDELYEAFQESRENGYD